VAVTCPLEVFVVDTGIILRTIWCQLSRHEECLLIVNQSSPSSIRGIVRVFLFLWCSRFCIKLEHLSKLFSFVRIFLLLLPSNPV
jgi:hypothetical protein